MHYTGLLFGSFVMKIVLIVIVTVAIVMPTMSEGSRK